MDDATTVRLIRRPPHTTLRRTTSTPLHPSLPHSFILGHKEITPNFISVMLTGFRKTSESVTVSDIEPRDIGGHGIARIYFFCSRSKLHPRERRHVLAETAARPFWRINSFFSSVFPRARVDGERLDSVHAEPQLDKVHSTNRLHES